MVGPMVLQLFLFLNVFVIGILVALGVQHARAHFHPEHSAEKPRQSTEVRLPAAERERLIHEAEAHFQLVLSRNAKEFTEQLTKTSAELNETFKKSALKTIDQEVAGYQATLEQMKQVAAGAVERAQTAFGGNEAKLAEELATRRAELDQKLTAAVEDRRQALVAQIDTKLSDAVISFLFETLGHDVDLGAQVPYIVAQLDAHKDELKAEVKS
jgi:hypothetical protein